MNEKLELSLFTLCFVCVLVLCNGTETPQFTIVRSESDFEIRLYKESEWVTAPVREISFKTATREGFHRLYQYIHGANSNSSELTKTAPILTSISQDTQTSDKEYYVRLYVSTEFQGAPPRPFPELNLQFDKWRSHCVAVRKFSGFVMDDTINKEVEDLVTSLGRLQIANSTVLEDKYAYTIAQYNAPFHVAGRLNEVWMNVSGFMKEHCQSS